jgi:alpha-tubulin suppressor-like RCC1 family protein
MRLMRVLVLCLLCALAAAALGAGGALAASPAATAWGGNSSGQLGDGTLESSREPIPVSGLGEVLSVAAGSEHSLALLPNGTVMAWGANTAGQLGDGNNTSSDVPVPVSGLTGVTAIAAGGEFSLALLSNGHVMAWGQNLEGELGDGLNNSSNVPVEVSGLSEVTAISAGGKHALALQSDQRVKAWGSNKDGQLGIGVIDNDELTPVEVKELGGVTAISAGGLHSLALLSSGTVEAWGGNGSGQLGNGTKTNSDTAVAVQGLIGVHAIAAGEAHSVAALTGGEVFAWGDGKSGELGNGLGVQSSVPVQASGLTEVSSVEAGKNFSIALQASGNVWTWGVNGEGQLGTGTKEAHSLSPVEVTAIHQVTQVSGGGSQVLVAGPQLPTVTGVSPIEGSSVGGTHVTITGTGFSGVTEVHFGANAATEFTVESTTTIKAVAPAGTGTVPVTVTIPGGTSGQTPASDFSYTPIVTGVTPATGSQEGGTKVVIAGSNFEGVTAVKFGGVAAPSFKVESTTEVTAVSPPGLGTEDVTLVGPGGESQATPADHFVYVSSPPEIGRCVKAGKHGTTGKYSDNACTTIAPEEKGKFEWESGPGTKNELKGKSPKLETVKFETVGHKEVQCQAPIPAKLLSGNYVNSKLISNIVIKFTGCRRNEHEDCKTAGEKTEGVITTKALTGTLGIIKVEPKPEEDQVGFAIGAPGGGTFMEFECAKELYVFRGGAILPYKLTDRMLKSEKVKFFEDKGHQNVEAFENEPSFVLSAQIGGAPAEQAGMILTLELSGKEKLEVNLLH